MSDNRTVWFPAKRYGWGWGAPGAWQGWAVLAAFGILLIGGALLLLPGGGPAVFVAYAVVLGLVLVAICWMKGEPPRWRWGGE